jgi:hypothetical protein
VSRAKSISCAEPSVGAEELDAGLGELVRLVEDRDLDARQQLGDAAVAQRHVGEEEMMVDDDDVGEHRLAPRLHHVALAVLRAFAAEAVLARRRDERDDAAALVEALELGEVAARGRQRPRLDLGERADGEAVGKVSVLPGAAEPMQAEIARATLQERHRHRQVERAAKARQIAEEELVLERLGRGAEQRPGTAEQRRDEVGEGLADAGAGLDDERATLLDRGRDSERHVELDRAFGMIRIDRCERAGGAERELDGLLQLARCERLRDADRRHLRRSEEPARSEGAATRPHRRRDSLRAAPCADATRAPLMPAGAARARIRFA